MIFVVLLGFVTGFLLGYFAGAEAQKKRHQHDWEKWETVCCIARRFKFGVMTGEHEITKLERICKTCGNREWKPWGEN
jgi:hypothetical protein